MNLTWSSPFFPDLVWPAKTSSCCSWVIRNPRTSSLKQRIILRWKAKCCYFSTKASIRSCINQFRCLITLFRLLARAYPFEDFITHFTPFVPLPFAHQIRSRIRTLWTESSSKAMVLMTARATYLCACSVLLGAQLTTNQCLRRKGGYINSNWKRTTRKLVKVYKLCEDLNTTLSFIKCIITLIFTMRARHLLRVTRRV